ncbi:ribokinase [Chelativorans salis]|uniref:Ribokinase n=1 Tax=Chelativorans salis TaxID=2978478 RepID=A0ABT2LNR6_9HYPH|nr:ribokinase [Chelativorans sp. EGI FJ00035]MCT7376207.1 ribokinase [Chelativorans sp. EGI FJ00035]
MITIVGSINLDLIARVKRLPGPGETVPGDEFSTAPGGKGANQALAARRAGASVRMVGAVGSDAFAGEATALLKEAGVDLSTVKERDTATGTAVILVGGDGENMIAVIPGANGQVLPKDVEQATFRPSEFVLLQHEVPLETVKATLEAARAVGAVSLLNTAPFHAEAAGFLALADYVVANETEFELYAEALALDGENREARMHAFAKDTGRTIVVTLGKDGVVAATPEDFLRVPTLSITPVDTVGAGDTFCGYLAAGLAEGLTLKEALRRAAVAGALACLQPGAQPAIPIRADVDAAAAR